MAEPSTNIVSRIRKVGTPRLPATTSAGHGADRLALHRRARQPEPDQHGDDERNEVHPEEVALVGGDLWSSDVAVQPNRSIGFTVELRTVDARELLPLGDDLVDDLAQRKGRDGEEEQVCSRAIHAKAIAITAATAMPNATATMKFMPCGSPTPTCSHPPSRRRPGRTRTARTGRTRSRSRRPSRCRRATG